MFIFCLLGLLLLLCCWLLEKDKQVAVDTRSASEEGERVFDLLTLLDQQLLCIHPNHLIKTHSRNRNVSIRVREEVIGYLNVIKDREPGEVVPLHLLNELARKHYCGIHLRKLDEDLVQTAVEQWQDDLKAEDYRIVNLLARSREDAGEVSTAGQRPIFETYEVQKLPCTFDLDFDDTGRIVDGSTSFNASSGPADQSILNVVGGKRHSFDSINEAERPTRNAVLDGNKTPTPWPAETPEADQPCSICKLRLLEGPGRGALEKEILHKPMTKKDSKYGIVYVLQRPGCDEHFKVRFTTGPAEDRVKSINSCCGVDWKIVHHREVPNAKKVETLIHLESRMHGSLFENCCWLEQETRSVCVTAHQEIVAGNLESVTRCVDHWSSWMATSGQEGEDADTPYNEVNGRIKSKWQRGAFLSEEEAAEIPNYRTFYTDSHGVLWTHIKDNQTSPAVNSSPLSVGTLISPRRSQRPKKKVAVLPESANPSASRSRNASMPNLCTPTQTTRPSIAGNRPATNPLPFRITKDRSSTPSARRRSLRSSPSLAEMPRKVWTCHRCTTQNYSLFEKCFLCESPKKPKLSREAVSGDVDEAIFERSGLEVKLPSGRSFGKTRYRLRRSELAENDVSSSTGTSHSPSRTT